MVSAAAQRRPRRLARAFGIEDLQRIAARRLPKALFDFYAGGAEDERTLRANLGAYAGIALAPRVLTGVVDIDPAAPLLGAVSALPLAVAPMGAVAFGWPDGDVALARAAARAGVPYALSMMGGASVERVAAAMSGVVMQATAGTTGSGAAAGAWTARSAGTADKAGIGGAGASAVAADVAAGASAAAGAPRLWLQVYPLKQQDVLWRLVDRALAAGCEALIVTVDVPVGGKRERDLRNDFSMPFRYTPRNLLGFARRPAWALGMLLRGLPKAENLAGLAPVAATAAEQVASVGREFDPAFDWNGLARIRDHWPRKMIVKGLLHADDARRAADLGCDAVVVSNHGGRQLDSAAAALAALPAVAAAVGGRIDVLVDGGIRRGGDIAKALALGADGVLVGRAALWGVCAGGEAGAALALDILRDEFVRCLQLCGAASAGDVDRRLLLDAAGAPLNPAEPG